MPNGKKWQSRVCLCNLTWQLNQQWSTAQKKHRWRRATWKCCFQILQCYPNQLTPSALSWLVERKNVHNASYKSQYPELEIGTEGWKKDNVLYAESTSNLILQNPWHIIIEQSASNCLQHQQTEVLCWL